MLEAATGETAIEVTYRLTKDDIREAVRPFVRRFVLRYWAVVIVLVVVVEVLLWLLRRGGESNAGLSLFFPLLGLAWLPVGWWLGLRTAVRAVDPYVFEERTVRADDAGLDVERETGHSTIAWSFFRSWRKAESLIILTHGETTYFPVPNRAFQSDDQREEFVRLVESNVGSSEGSAS